MHSPFLMKWHSCPLFLLIYFSFTPRVSGIDAMENWWEKPCIFHEVGDTIGWKSGGKKYPYFWESMGTNLMAFAEFSHAIENWLENPYISHVMKNTIEWESNGKSHPYYGKSVSINFPDLPHTVGFVGFFRTMGNWWENSCISHVISMPHYGNWMGKKYPYYGKSMITNFPGFPHTMGFVAFSRTMVNWWENSCISHIMRFVKFFLCYDWYVMTDTPELLAS